MSIYTHCEICDVTAKRGFHFDSHLATEAHRHNKIVRDNSVMLNALEMALVVIAGDPSNYIEEATVRAAIAKVKGESNA